MIEEHRTGYLRYKCRSCGALIKRANINPSLVLKRIVANNGAVMEGVGVFDVHENCDSERAGLADLLGVTFDEET